MTDAKGQRLAVLNRLFAEGVPHNKMLGLHLIDFDGEAGMALLRMPCDDKLVGNPLTGMIHEGAITSLMDAGCGRRFSWGCPRFGRSRRSSRRQGRRVINLGVKAWQDDPQTPIATAAVNLLVAPSDTSQST